MHHKKIIPLILFVIVLCAFPAGLLFAGENSLGAAIDHDGTPQIEFFADRTEGWAIKTISQFAVIGAVIILINFFLFAAILQNFKKSRLLNSIFIHQAMETELPTATLQEHVRSIATKFKHFTIDHIAVVSEFKHLEGVISREKFQKHLSNLQADIHSLDSGKVILPDNVTAKHVMTKEVEALFAYNTLSDAVKLIEKNRFKCIPIIDEDQHLIGMLSEQNIINAIHFFMVSPANPQEVEGIKIKTLSKKSDKGHDEGIGGLFSKP